MSLKAQKTLFGVTKDTNLCIKFTILERYLHYLMITPCNRIYVLVIFSVSRSVDE